MEVEIKNLRIKAGDYIPYKKGYLAHVILSHDEEGYVNRTVYRFFKTEFEAILACLNDHEGYAQTTIIREEAL